MNGFSRFARSRRRGSAEELFRISFRLARFCSALFRSNSVSRTIASLYVINDIPTNHALSSLVECRFTDKKHIDRMTNGSLIHMNCCLKFEFQ